MGWCESRLNPLLARRRVRRTKTTRCIKWGGERSGSERVRGREMQRDVSGPMERLHHRDRMQTASPPPPRVLIEYAKSLLRAPPIRGCLGTQISGHALEWRALYIGQFLLSRRRQEFPLFPSSFARNWNEDNEKII